MYVHSKLILHKNIYFKQIRFLVITLIYCLNDSQSRRGQHQKVITKVCLNILKYF